MSNRNLIPLRPITGRTASEEAEFDAQAAGLADCQIQTCSDRVLHALADYNAVMEDISKSMSPWDVNYSTTTLSLRYQAAWAATAKAIEEMAACVPPSLADFAAKKAVLDATKPFRAGDPRLGEIIDESTSRDIAHLAKPRRSSPSWFPYVSFPSWSSRPRTKARASSDKS